MSLHMCEQVLQPNGSQWSRPNIDTQPRDDQALGTMECCYFCKRTGHSSMKCDQFWQSRVIGKINRLLYETGNPSSRMDVAPGVEASQRGKLLSDFLLDLLMPDRQHKLSLIHSVTLQLKTSLFSPKLCTSASFLLCSIWNAILNPNPPSRNPEATKPQWDIGRVVCGTHKWDQDHKTSTFFFSHHLRQRCNFSLNHSSPRHSPGTFMHLRQTESLPA